LPVSLLEAWAVGLPVVCSAVGGIPQVVTDEFDGLLFPNGDETAIESALFKVLNDPALAARLGGAGKNKVRAEYSLERMAADYESRYRNLVAGCRERT
jgi:glycosyltransferase involved in cell wall biosynthesis